VPVLWGGVKVHELRSRQQDNLPLDPKRVPVMRSLRCAAGIVAALLMSAGCDPQKVSQLEEGVSTEQDVRARFGAPETIWMEPNGDRTFEYPRQPAGHANYMISIGPDGKMSSLRQVLHPNYFAKVTPGLTKDEVRRMLGKPAKVQTYRQKGEEVWDWRFADGTTGVKVFSVTFDPNGAVLGTAVGLDPNGPDQRG
jgi:outer membrane protein assembly factor BamE (lipoprotein component of BamABCDE complex)